MGFGKCHLFSDCGVMKFFIISLFLLLLFDSPQGSSSPHRRSIRALNTTLQTNFDGTYERRNPCTNAEIETSSYTASHEFHHHTKEDTWSDYSHKCSGIISGFLQAIANLVRSNNNQNGIFNFHINTSISQKQDGHCDFNKQKSCDSLPVIIIEATGDEIPPRSSTENSLKTEKSWERKYSISGQLSDGESITGNLLTTTPLQTQHNEITTSAPRGQDIFYSNDYPTTPQCQTTSIPLKDTLPVYPPQPAKQNFEGEQILQNGLLTATQTPNSVPSFAPQFAGTAIPDETSPAVFNPPLNRPTYEPEQKPDFYGISPKPVFNPNVPNAITLPPENEFPTVPFPTACEPLPPNTFEKPPTSAVTCPENPEPLNPISSPPIPFNEEIEFNIPRTTPSQPFYDSTQDFSQKAITVNNEEQLIQNQHQPFLVGGEGLQTVDSRQPFYDNLGGRVTESQQSATPIIPVLPPNQADMPLQNPQIPPNFMGSAVSPVPVPVEFSQSGFPSDASSFSIPPQFPDAILSNTKTQNQAITSATVRLENDELSDEISATNPPRTDEDFLIDSRPTIPNDRQTPAPELPTTYPSPSGETNMKMLPTDFATSESSFPTESLVLDQQTTKTIDVIESGFTDAPFPSNIGTQPTPNILCDNRPTTLTPQQQFPTKETYDNQNYNEFSPMTTQLPSFFIPQRDPNSYNNEPYSPNVNGKFLSTPVESTQFPINPEPFTSTVSDLAITPKTELPYPGPASDSDSAPVTSTFQAIATTKVQPPQSLIISDFATPKPEILRTATEKTTEIFEIPQNPTTPTLLSIQSQVQTTKGSELPTSAQYSNESGEPGPSHSTFNNKNMPNTLDQSQLQITSIPPFSQFPSILSPNQQPTGDYQIPTQPTYSHTNGYATEFENMSGPALQTTLGFSEDNNGQISQTDVPPEQELTTNGTFNQFPSTFSPEQQPIGEYKISTPPVSPPTYDYESMTPKFQNMPGSEFQTPLPMPDISNPQTPYTEIPPQQISTNDPFNQLSSTLSPEQQPMANYTIPEITSSPPIYPEGTMRPEFQTSVSFPGVNNPQIPFTDVPPEQQISTIPPFNQFHSNLSPEQQPIGKFEISPLPIPPPTHEYAPMTSVFQNVPRPEFQTPLPVPDINNTQIAYTEIPPEQISTNTPFNQLFSTLSPGQQPMADHTIPEITSSPPMSEGGTMRPEFQNVQGPEFQTPLGLPDVNNPQIPFTDVPPEHQVSTIPPLNQFPSTFSQVQQPTENNELPIPTTSPPIYEEKSTTVASDFQPPIGLTVVNKPEIPFTATPPEQQVSPSVGFNPIPSTFSPEQRPTEFQPQFGLPAVNYPETAINAIPPEQQVSTIPLLKNFPPTSSQEQLPTSPPLYENETPTTVPTEVQPTTDLPAVINPETPNVGIPPEQQVSTNFGLNPFPSSFSPEQQPIGQYKISPPPLSPPTNDYGSMTPEFHNTPGPEFQTPPGFPAVNNPPIPFTDVPPEQQVSTIPTLNQFPFSPKQEPIGQYNISPAPFSPPTLEYGDMRSDFQNMPGPAFQAPVGMPDVYNPQLPYTDIQSEQQQTTTAGYNQLPSTLSPGQQPVPEYKIPEVTSSPSMSEGGTMRPEFQNVQGPEFQAPLGLPDVNNPQISFTDIPPELQLTTIPPVNQFLSTSSQEQPTTSPSTYNYETTTSETVTSEFQPAAGMPDVNNMQTPVTGISPEQISTILPLNQIASTLSPEQQPIGQYEVSPPSISPPTYDNGSMTPEFHNTPGSGILAPLGLAGNNSGQIPYTDVSPEQQLTTTPPVNQFPSTFSQVTQPTENNEFPTPTSPPIYEEKTSTTVGPEFQPPLGLPVVNNPEPPILGIPPEQQVSTIPPLNQIASTFSSVQQTIGQYESSPPPASPPTNAYGSMIPEFQNTPGPEFQAPVGLTEVNTGEIPYTDVPPEQQLTTISPVNEFPTNFMTQQQPTADYKAPTPPISPSTYDYETTTTVTSEFQPAAGMPDVNNMQTPVTGISPEQISTILPLNQIASTLSPEQQPIGEYKVSPPSVSPPTYDNGSMTPEFHNTPGPEFQTPLGLPDVNSQTPITDVLPAQQVSTIPPLNQSPSTFSPEQQPIGEYKISTPPASPPTYDYESMTPKFQNMPGSEFQTPLLMPDINSPQIPFTEIPPEQVSTNPLFNMSPSTLSPGQQPTADYKIPEITSSPPMYPEGTMRPEFQNMQGPEFQTPLGLPDVKNPQIPFTDVPSEQPVPTNANFNQFPSTFSPGQEPTEQYEISSSSISPSTFLDESTTTVGPELQPPTGSPVLNNPEMPFTGILPEQQDSTQIPFNQYTSTYSPEQQSIGENKIQSPLISPPTHEYATMRPEFQTTVGMPDVNNPQIPYTEIPPQQQLTRNAPQNQFPSTLKPELQPIADYEIPPTPTSPPPIEYQTMGPEFQTPVGLPASNNLQSSYTGFPPEQQFSTNATPNQFPSSFSSEQEPIVNNDIPEPPTSATTYEYETTTIAPEIQPAFGFPDVNNQQKPFTGIPPEEQVLRNPTFNQFPSTSQEQSPITPPTYDYGSMTPEFQDVPGPKFQTPVSMPDINNQQIAYTDVTYEQKLLSNAPFNQSFSTSSPEQQPIENYESPTPPTSPPIYEEKTTTTVATEIQTPIGLPAVINPDFPVVGIPPEQQVSPNVGFNQLPSTLSPGQQPVPEYKIPEVTSSPSMSEGGTMRPEFQNVQGPEFQAPLGIPDVNKPQISVTDIPPEQQLTTIPPVNQFLSTSSQEQPTTSPPTYNYETTTTVTTEFQPPTGLPVINNPEMPLTESPPEQQVSTNIGLNPFPSTFSPEQRPIGQYEISSPPVSPPTYDYESMTPEFHNTPGSEFQTPLPMSDINNPQVPFTEIPPEQVSTNPLFNMSASTLSPGQQPTADYKIPEITSSPPMYPEGTMRPEFQNMQGPEFQTPLGLPDVNSQTPITDVLPAQQVSTIPPLNQSPSTFSPEQQPIGEYKISTPPVSPPTYDYESMTPKFQNMPGSEFQTPLPMSDINNPQVPFTEIPPEQVSTNPLFNMSPSTLSPGQQPMSECKIPEITSSPPMYPEGTMRPEFQNVQGPEFQTPLGLPDVNSQTPITDVFPAQQVSTIPPLNQIASPFSPEQQTIGQYESSPPPVPPPTDDYGSITPEFQNTPGPEFQTPLPIPDINNPQNPYTDIPREQLSINPLFNMSPSTLPPGQQPMAEYEIPQITPPPPMSEDGTMRPESQNLQGPELQSPFGLPDVKNPQMPFTDVEEQAEQPVPTNANFNELTSSFSPAQQPTENYKFPTPPTSPPTYEDESMRSLFQSTLRPEFQGPIGLPNINNQQIPYHDVQPEPQFSSNAPFNQFPSTVSPEQEPIVDYDMPEPPSAATTYEDIAMTTPSPPTGPTQESQNSLDHRTEIPDYTIRDSQGQTSNTFDNSSPFQPEALATNGLVPTTTLLPTYTNGPDNINTRPDLSLLDAQSESQRPDQEFGSNFNVPTPLLGNPHTDDRPDLAFVSPAPQPITNDGTTVKYDGGTVLPPEFGPTPEMNNQQFSPSISEIPDTVSQYQPTREPTTLSTDLVDPQYATSPGQQIEHPQPLDFQPRDQVPNVIPFNNQQFNLPTDQLFQPSLTTNPASFGQFSSTVSPEYLSGEPVTTSEYQTPEPQPPFLNYPPQISNAESQSSQTEQPQPITTYDQPSTLFTPQPPIELYGETVPTTPQINQLQSVDYTQQPSEYNKPEPELPPIPQENFSEYRPTSEVYSESIVNGNIGRPQSDSFVSFPPLLETTPSDIPSQTPPFEAYSDGTRGLTYGTMSSYQTPPPTLAPEQQTTEPPHFGPSSTDGPLNSYPESEPKIAEFPATDFPLIDSPADNDSNRLEVSSQDVTTLQPYGSPESSPYPDQLNRYNVRNRPDRQLSFGGTTTPQYLENSNDQRVEPSPVNTTERPELDQQQIVLENPVSPNYADYDQGFSTPPPKLTEYGEITPDFTPRGSPLTDNRQFVTEDSNVQQFGIAAQRETDSPLGFGFEERSPPNSNIQTYPPPQQKQRSNPLLETLESQMPFPMFGPPQQIVASSYPEQVSLDARATTSTPFSFEPQNKNGVSTDPPYYPEGNFKRNFVTSQPIVNTPQDVTNIPLSDSQALVSDLSSTPSNKPDGTTARRVGYMSRPLRNPYMRSIG